MICFSIINDASWLNNDSKIGIGWTLDDSFGRYILKGSASMEATHSVLEAEALALREALVQLKRLNYQNVTFCGDSISLYGHLEKNAPHQAQMEGPQEIQGYLHDIITLAHDTYKFKYINRKANNLADTLARHARINNSPMVVSWIL
ncbi:Ribonuclease H-like superfamily [Arabidopsis suecica]|uniref:Ribonuclease H-like superfamily n=1 Tax=Arabidopsis suecica TaxID=45249 RepID=A0A8T1ZFV7_ARASU|nr:Ribonuclease H-like superfamily [Arabidopsis suecica]